MKRMVENEKTKKMLVIFWTTFMIAVVAFVIIFITFSKKLKSTADIGLLTSNSVNVVVPNTGVESTSISSDKDINTVANEVLDKIDNETQASTQNVNAKEEVNSTSLNIDEKTTSSSENTSQLNETPSIENEEVEETKPLEFCAPVSGDIITDYADESLVYSKTLDEWTTHLGIDIKAEKASTVVASERGTIKSIKNDPRYGLTITISHSDGYETVYSNLLSSEFVAEGDEVDKGQTIGTVGESASFEVSEVPHLHFEMYKDGNSINPTTMLK